MCKFIKYNFEKYSKKDYNYFLNKLLKNNIKGVIIDTKISVNEKSNSKFQTDLNPHINEMVILAHEKGLQTGLEISIFESKLLWDHNNFSPPVSSYGTEFIPKWDYYPVCPNNKLSTERLNQLLIHFENIVPDYYILKEFRFPYDWQHNSLDLQEKIPTYCYCPYCIGEFSASAGVIINNVDTLYDNITNWMQWRFEVLIDYLTIIMNKLSVKKSILIQVPPLNLVDIPFSTGQVLLDFAELGAKISPLLFHKTKDRDPMWGLEILDIFKIDIPSKIIIPSIQRSDEHHPGNILPAYTDYEDVMIY